MGGAAVAVQETEQAQLAVGNIAAADKKLDAQIEDMIAVQETEQAAKAAAVGNIAAADKKLDAQTAKSKHSEEFCTLRNGMKKVQLTIARAAKAGVTVKAHGDMQAYHKQT